MKQGMPAVKPQIGGTEIMKIETFHERFATIALPGASAQEGHSASPADVFLELVKLLEDYAPTWYTEEQHERAQAATLALRSS
jgi:hypothetical protein